MPVLVGFAPTPEGRAAVRRAVAECELRRTELILVSSERTGNVPVDVGTCLGEIQDASAELGVRVPGHEIRLFAGSVEPADDVLTVAEDTGAELIVIGLRRRSPVGKLILGGSAQRILLEASCPVLAVKGSADQLPGNRWAAPPTEADLDSADLDGPGSGSPALNSTSLQASVLDAAALDPDASFDQDVALEAGSLDTPPADQPSRLDSGWDSSSSSSSSSSSGTGAGSGPGLDTRPGLDLRPGLTGAQAYSREQLGMERRLSS